MRSGNFIQALESRRLLSANLVADFDGFYPTDAIEIGKYSYFAANDGVHGYELWKSDGTANGTALVKDMTPGSQSSEIMYMRRLGNGVIFINRIYSPERTTLWYSGGTARSTIPLAVLPGDAYVEYVSPTLVNGRYLFTVVGLKPDSKTGTELWSSDGTVEGSGRIALLDEHPVVGYLSAPGFVGNRMVFAGGENKLWSTDGTAAGTFTIPGMQHGLPSDFTDGSWWLSSASEPLLLNGKLVLPGQFTNEIFLTDGTVQGTTLLARPPLGLSPLVVSGNRLFLWGYRNDASELWVSDGTAAGTRELASLGEWLSGGSPRILDGKLILFTMTDDYGMRIWQSDGTPEGTMKLNIPSLRPTGVAPVILGDKILFFAVPGPEDSVSPRGISLWSLDQQQQLTQLKYIGEYGTNYTVVVQNMLYFDAWKTGEPGHVWQSDGTADGTKVVTDIGGDHQFSMNAVDNRLVISWGGEFNPDQHYSKVVDPSVGAASLAPATSTVRLADGTLRVYGTVAEDAIRISCGSDPSRLIVQINGIKRSFDVEEVKKIVIYGYGGDDKIEIFEKRGIIAVRSRIFGGEGDDTICTGSGQDTVYAENGDDVVKSGNSADVISGDEGDDTINAGAGNDTANGDAGTDSIIGGAGADMLGGGDDQSDDFLDGGSGQDVVFGSAVYDIFYKPAGDPGELVDCILQS